MTQPLRQNYFFVALIGFAASFNCNYGGSVSLFASPGVALFNTFYMAMGSYDDAYAALRGSGQGELGLELLITPFIFIVVLVMLDVFLAIVVDYPADPRLRGNTTRAHPRWRRPHQPLEG